MSKQLGIKSSDTLFTSTEAAQYMGFTSGDTIRQYINRKMITGRMVGTLYLVTKTECDRYLRERRRRGRPAAAR